MRRRPAPDNKDDGYGTVIDAGIDAPVDAPPDARPDARPRPDAAPDAPLVAIADAGADDAAQVAVADDAGVAVATTDVGSGSGSGAGSGSGSADVIAMVGSGSGSDGSGSRLGGRIRLRLGLAAPTPRPRRRVDGAPTTAGTAANLLAYFPAGHVVTAMVRFDRLRGTRVGAARRAHAPAAARLQDAVRSGERAEDRRQARPRRDQLAAAARRDRDDARRADRAVAAGAPGSVDVLDRRRSVGRVVREQGRPARQARGKRSRTTSASCCRRSRAGSCSRSRTISPSLASGKGDLDTVEAHEQAAGVARRDPHDRARVGRQGRPGARRHAGRRREALHVPRGRARHHVAAGTRARLARDGARQAGLARARQYQVRRRRPTRRSSRPR